MDHYDDSVSFDVLNYASKNKNIRLGLCCINNTLRNPTNKKDKPVYCGRTCIRSTFSVEKAQQLSLDNVKDIVPLVKWNVENGISHLRLSSDLFPHYTDEETESYTMDFAIPELKKAGDYIKSVKHRVTMHPAQWNQVGAISEKVFEKTCADLKYHADILDNMQIDESGILCVHGGGMYGDKESTIRRWIDQFDDLPSTVKKRLAIENCEKCYSVKDCLEIANSCNIPLIYDTHHYHCYNLYHPNETQIPIRESIPEILETWDKKGVRPVFHISEQKPNKTVGTHSDMIENIPAHLLEIPKLYSVPIDIEVEAKNKEEAVLYLNKKYNL
jgi:UV DNA damage endonuclease